MANISTLSILLNTGNLSGAGTDGDVYVGICGREFYLDTSSDDFERNSSRVYVLGEGANTLHPATNDPRKPQLRDEDVDRYPVYVRFNPRGRSDNWNLVRAAIHINGATLPLFDSALEREGGIWLGIRSTLFYYLRRHIDPTGPGVTGQ